MRRDEDFDAGDFEATRRLLETARGLPRSIEPEHDLWPQIARRIRAGEGADASGVRAFAGERRSGWRSKWTRGILAAAAVIVLFVLGYATGVLRPPGGPGEDERGTLTTEAPNGSPVEIAAYEGGSDVSPVDWTAADAAIAQLLAERSGELDPEMIALIRTNLEIIDVAIREIRAALDDDPGNPELERLLNAGYRSRGALIRRTADYAESI